jgi:hypothetical protein
MKIFAIAFVSMLLICASAEAGNDENKEFFNATMKKFTEECKEKKGIDYANCRAEISPEKCKSLVYSNKDESGWQRCVYSCGSAGIYSKTFGECSD